MSFIDGLSATASAAHRQSRDEGVQAFVDKFKLVCQQRAKDGFFKAECKYTFSVGEKSSNNAVPAAAAASHAGVGGPMRIGPPPAHVGVPIRIVPFPRVVPRTKLAAKKSAPADAHVTLKRCVGDKKSEFEEELKAEVKALGFKHSDVTVTWPTVEVLAVLGKVQLTGEWPETTSGGGTSVKREHEAPGTSGGSRAVRPRTK